MAVALAAAAAAFASPSTAAAAEPPNVEFAVGSQPMLVAQQIARAYWGMDACQGQVTIDWTQLEPDINATSTWSNPVAAYGDGAENTDCRIDFNDTVPFDWPMFCTVVVHEYGHLTGHPHSPDPHDVMTPVYDGPLKQCADTPEPGVPAVAARAPARPAAHVSERKPIDRVVARRPQPRRAGIARRGHRHRRARGSHSVRHGHRPAPRHHRR